MIKKEDHLFHLSLQRVAKENVIIKGGVGLNEWWFLRFSNFTFIWAIFWNDLFLISKYLDKINFRYSSRSRKASKLKKYWSRYFYLSINGVFTSIGKVKSTSSWILVNSLSTDQPTFIGIFWNALLEIEKSRGIGIMINRRTMIYMCHFLSLYLYISSGPFYSIWYDDVMWWNLADKWQLRLHVCLVCVCVCILNPKVPIPLVLITSHYW